MVPLQLRIFFYFNFFYDIGIEVLENEDGFLAEDEDLFPLAADG